MTIKFTGTCRKKKGLMGEERWNLCLSDRSPPPRGSRRGTWSLFFLLESQLYLTVYEIPFNCPLNILLLPIVESSPASARKTTARCSSAFRYCWIVMKGCFGFGIVEKHSDLSRFRSNICWLALLGRAFTMENNRNKNICERKYFISPKQLKEKVGAFRELCIHNLLLIVLKYFHRAEQHRGLRIVRVPHRWNLLGDDKIS